MKIEDFHWTEARQNPSKFWENLQHRLRLRSRPVPDSEQRILDFLMYVATEDQIKYGMLMYLSDESVTNHSFSEFCERFVQGWNQLDEKHGEWWWRYYEEDSPEFSHFDKRAKQIKAKLGDKVLYSTPDEFVAYKEWVDEVEKTGFHRPPQTDFEWMVERDPDIASAMLIIELSRLNLGVMLSPEQIKIFPELDYAVEGFKDQRSNPFDNSHEWEYRSEVMKILKKAA